jgi:YbbR domain-containing protein
MSLNIDGFHTLRYKMIRDRVVTIPLNEVSYRLENGNTYSFSSQYVAEKVAEKLNINASDITMNDAKIYFTLDALKSKVVPVVLQSNVTTARQYDIYGIPTLDPSSVTVYGPQEVIDTIKTVRTEPLIMNNVSQNFNATLPLDLLGGRIHSNVKEVKAEVQVEKFTEMDVEVPIKMTDSLKMRFFPETMTVKCLVAMRDYASITPENFAVAVDKQQLKAMQPLLDVRLASWPPTVQILSTRPDKVEYLIVQ